MTNQKQSYIYIVIAIIIILIICGSLWDLEIANKIYIGETPSNNIFGIIFSYIGVIPTFVGWSFFGSCIFYLTKKQIKDKIKRRLLIGFSILLFILSFFYFCNTLYLANSNSFKIHFVFAYAIGITIISFAGYLGYKFSKKNNDIKLLKNILFLSFISLIALLIISFTKEIMCRPRYRFILTNDISYYKDWWENGRLIKNKLSSTIVSDEFSSFPSGHSAYSMFAIILFPTISEYIGGQKKIKFLLFLFGFVWWVLTALSRLTMGAHYLTDVAFGGLITLIAYTIVLIAKNIYIKQKNKKGK